MTVSDPRTVDEVDLCLRNAAAGLRRARAYRGNARFVYVAAALGRVDRFLDLRMEMQRSEAEHHVEEWWCWSWPGTAAPEWPQESEEVAS